MKQNIVINVSKQIDGYSFSLSSLTKRIINDLIPTAKSANIISVNYDVNSSFENKLINLCDLLYIPLLGIVKEELIFFGEIIFVDSELNEIYKINNDD